MKVVQEDIISNQTVLQVALEPDDVEKYLNWAYKRVVQKISVPGFRKGKAPRSILERFVGKEALLNEAMDYLVTDATKNALDMQNLKAAIFPDVSIEKLDPTIELKITVPLVPQVDLGSYKDIRVPEEPLEITEQQVRESMEQLRKQLAPWEPVERAVNAGDLLTLDIRATVEGKEISNEKDAVYQAEESNQRPVPGFAQKLTGLSKGLEQEFTLTIPADYPVTDIAGKECLFVVTVKEIKEQKLPEFNDDFAKSVGDGYDSLDALKKKLRDNLEEHTKVHIAEKYREQVVDFLVQDARIELPPLLLDREVDSLIQDDKDALEKRQMNMEQYLAQAGKTPEQLKEEYKAIATKRLNRSWALTKLAELENVQVSEEDVNAQVEALIASSAPQRSKEMRRVFGSQRGRDSIHRSILTSKVVDKLAAIARGEDAANTTSEETQPSQENTDANKDESP